MSTSHARLPKLQALIASLALLATSALAGGAHEWAAGGGDLPVLEAYETFVVAAVEKTLLKAPGWKPGADALVLITASDGGSRASLVGGNLTEDQAAEFGVWISKWILPVGEPGMALPVHVWWEKPQKGEKEKLKKGQERTKPPAGLRFAAGFDVVVTGGVAAEEVVRAERLVFSSEQACPDEVADMRPGSVITTFWHLEVDGVGAVAATPQDLWIPPPDPTTREGKRALAAMEEAEAPEAPGVEAPEGAPKVEAPKFELPGAPKFEAPEKPEVEVPEEEAEEVEPPREWTPLELCVADALARARIRPPEDAAPTHVDGFPVVARLP